jgi:hypothetical protein
MDSLQDWR